MCQCLVHEPPDIGADMITKSLLCEGSREANEYRWIRSEEAGCDKGPVAIEEWVNFHWNGFIRSRWLQHIHGEVYWTELRQIHFDVLNQRFRDCILVKEVVDRMKSPKDGENLNVILWSEQLDSDQRELVIQILEAIDINSSRVRFELIDDLCPR